MIIRLLFLLLLVIINLQTGCHFQGLMVRFADRVVMHELSEHFDLSTVQREKLWPEVKAQVAWLKANQFPVLITRLTQVKMHWSHRLESEDLLWARSQVRVLREQLAKRLADDAAMFLSTLSQEQVQHLATELDSDDQKRFQDQLAKSPEDFRADREKRLRKSLQNWFGEITTEQEIVMLAIIGNDRSVLVNQKEDLVAAQQGFLRALQDRENREKMAANIKTWATDPATLRPAGLPRQRYASLRKREDMIALALDAQLTTLQRQHALAKIDQIIQTLQ